MDQNQLPLSPQIVDEPQENVFAGAVGAVLFALAGGIVWFFSIFSDSSPHSAE